jgi:hypothetical protein
MQGGAYGHAVGGITGVAVVASLLWHGCTVGRLAVGALGDTVPAELLKK